jgi:hypothetical protein
MTDKVNIELKGAKKITAKPGSTVTLAVEFDSPCNSAIHERRVGGIYDILSTKENSDKHVFDVLVHDNTTDFIISSSYDDKPHLYMDGSNNYGQIWIKVDPTEEEEAFPCTDNAGKDEYPIELGYEKGASEGDSVFVNNITIQEKSGWCKCELIANNKAVKYTALEDNPTNEKRVVYFEHKTTEDTLSYGRNAGKPAMKTWIVTVTQDPNPNIKDKDEKEDEPINESIDQTKDLGKYQYSVGLGSDYHMCKANDDNSPSDSTDNWYDEDDFKTSMEIFKSDTNVKFISSCGDISEAQTNDSVKHPESTCETDYAMFTQMYDVPYWQVAGLRFFSPLGNHDFYGIFESRQGDTIVGKKRSETILGYNSNVNTRIGSWVTGQQINGIVPGRGRILFELENGKSTATGQADMNFFSYNDFVDLYAEAAKCTGSSIWDSNKGGISDTAIKLTKDYVNNNWEKVKDRLTMWNDGGGHGRNGSSKLNFWLKKDDCIYIYLSVDYGDDTWGVTSGWHDRMIHARTIINLNTDDPYVRRMKEFVKDTGYSDADLPYNYQYYSPNSLIWLKELLENNTDKKIFIFTHHYLPNKVGNGSGIAKDGAWSYADIKPAGELTSAGINKGSNCLTGIEFWFLNKLNNMYKNVVWFSGHSHISWESNANIDNHDYNIVMPSEGGKFVYTKASKTPKAESAWCVALPSLSKPRYLSPDGKTSSRRYDDAEIGIMEVFDNGIKIKGYKIKKDNKNVYDKSKPIIEKTIILK